MSLYRPPRRRTCPGAETAVTSGPHAAGARRKGTWYITAESEVATAAGTAVPVSGTRAAAACELHEISLFLSGPLEDGS